MTWRSCACLSNAGLLHSVDFRPLQRCLISKLGAVEDRRSHHVFYWLTIEGADHRIAKFSHSSRGRVPDFIVADTAARLKLSRRELDELAECTLTAEGFLELWASR